MKRKSSNLNPLGSAMQRWMALVCDASGFLGRLYLGLKDPLQRERALRAGAFAKEQTKGLRKSLTGAMPPWLARDQTQGERLAWLAVLEGMLGLNILVALSRSDSPEKNSVLHKRLDRELQLALLGFHTAFPGETVERDLDLLGESVIGQAALIADQAWREIRTEEESAVEVREFLQEEWAKSIRPGLMAMIRKS